MKFLNNVKKSGTIFVLIDIIGNQYRVSKYRKWRKLYVAQESSGDYAIIGSNRKSIGFIYDKLSFKGKFIVAYYSNEFEQYRYYHIYSECGRILCGGKVDPMLPSKWRITKKVEHYQKISRPRRYHK